MNLRALRLGLTTVLGLARRGFFIPYRYADQIPQAGTNAPLPAVRELFAAREDVFRRTLDLVATYQADLDSIGSEPPPAPRWAQDWFPRLDAAIAYTLVRSERPRRIIEIGSGHSTRFIAQAVADAALPCAVTAIDPAPRANLSGLDIDFLESTVQDVRAPFEKLRAGDFLFVDSSHVLMPGSDVDIVLNRILPVLPDGVWVHFHDIFLPDDYPAEWGWRGYNEQNAVAQLIFGGYSIQFASHYVTRAMTDVFEASAAAQFPLPPDARESSVWLRKGL